MKTAISLFVVLGLSAATLALARDSGSVTVTTKCCDEPARWAARHDPRDARLAVVTEDHAATLLLTSEVVAVQLSDRALHDIRRKLKDEQAEDANPLSAAIKAAVMGAVGSLLDHSAECPIRELRSVDYRNGRLEFTTLDGDRVLDNIDINSRDVMAGFSERDAKAFVREFRRMKSRRS